MSTTSQTESVTLTMRQRAVRHRAPHPREGGEVRLTSERVDDLKLVLEAARCGKKTDLVTLRGQHRSVDLCSVCIRSQ